MKKNASQVADSSLSEEHPQVTTKDEVSDTRNGGLARTVSEDKDESAATGWIYSDIVKEHFLRPHNFLMGDETKYPHDAEGIVGNPICGDQMKMFLQIDQKTGKIKEAKWKTYGCASAIASTSALSDMVVGKNLNEALDITADDINEFLGGLPPNKYHCSILGQDALKDAIKNYQEREVKDEK